MKKRTILGASLLLTLVGAAFATAAYKTTCGEVVYSVDQEFFEKQGDWIEHVSTLNEIYCGTPAGELISDDLHGHYEILR